MTTDTISAVDKARQLVESKITHIDKLEAAAAELEKSKQKFRDDYTAAINAGWSKDELKGIGFEALPTPKKTKTRRPASSTENRDQSSPASDSQAQNREAQDHGSDHQQDNHEQHEQFANA